MWSVVAVRLIVALGADTIDLLKSLLKASVNFMYTLPLESIKNFMIQFTNQIIFFGNCPCKMFICIHVCNIL